jgi:hypothetical protein
MIYTPTPLDVEFDVAWDYPDILKDLEPWLADGAALVRYIHHGTGGGNPTLIVRCKDTRQLGAFACAMGVGWAYGFSDQASA